MSDETEGCFTVLWTIENFSNCVSRCAVCLRGPVFETEIANESIRWMLHMSKTVSPNSTFRFSLNIVGGSDYPVKYEWCTLPFFSEETLDNSCSNDFCIRENVLIDKYRLYSHLPDNLNVRCTIRQKCLKNGECLKRTAMYKVNYFWNVLGYSFLSECHILYKQDLFSVIMTLFKNTGKRTHKVVVNALPNKEGHPILASCNIFFPNHDGCVIRNKNDDPSKYVVTIWDIKVFEEKLLAFGGLNIKLELLIAIEKDLPLSSSRINCMNIQQSVIVDQKSVPEVVAVSTGSLSEDLLLMYKGGTMSDATLTTVGKSFSVHKNILSARSSVFRAMFEDDRLSESRSGIVDIDDLDSATVDRLLVYLYSESLADMQWKDASALYYAADKYDVQPLKTKCADILKAGVAVSNACEALVLADKHSDKELLRCVVDFLRDHDEVISSAKWEELEEGNSRLTTKVMRELYLKKATK